MNETNWLERMASKPIEEVTIEDLMTYALNTGKEFEMKRYGNQLIYIRIGEHVWMDGEKNV